MHVCDAHRLLANGIPAAGSPPKGPEGLLLPPGLLHQDIPLGSRKGGIPRAGSHGRTGATRGSKQKVWKKQKLGRIARYLVDPLKHHVSYSKILRHIGPWIFFLDFVYIAND